MLVNVALRYAFLNVIGVSCEEIAQFIVNFAPTVGDELSEQLVNVVKGQNVQIEKLSRASAYDYYVSFTVLGGVLIALGKTEEYEKLKKHYFE